MIKNIMIAQSAQILVQQPSFVSFIIQAYIGFKKL